MSGAVLVTGGAGYVGSHVCKRLAEGGFTPITLDNFSAGHRWAVRWGPLVEGDIGDKTAVRSLLDAHRPVAAMHFAGSIAVDESVRDPLAYYQNNVAATLTLLSVLRDAGIDRFVFSSSAAVYGNPGNTPLVEDHPTGPISPYGASKLMIERVLGDLDGAHGLRSVSLRYFNAAGADPAAEIGEAHHPETHLIPRVLDVALARSREISIFGDDYDTPDGTCVRDYIHAGDLADAHVLALQYLLAGGATTCLNLGTGTGCSVQALVEAARKVTGRPIPARHAPRRPGDPAFLVADARAANTRLSWRPKRSAIEVILADAWRWHLKQFGK